ncbi:hypothetical protein NIES25_48500 [Nostoc linckia NIES-25]|nr:hypothetical protein NIES25_48500 [Nostoc linckia NIES-25]
MNNLPFINNFHQFKEDEALCYDNINRIEKIGAGKIFVLFKGETETRRIDDMDAEYFWEFFTVNFASNNLCECYVSTVTSMAKFIRIEESFILNTESVNRIKKLDNAVLIYQAGQEEPVKFFGRTARALWAYFITGTPEICPSEDAIKNPGGQGATLD